MQGPSLHDKDILTYNDWTNCEILVIFFVQISINRFPWDKVCVIIPLKVVYKYTIMERYIRYERLQPQI